MLTVRTALGERPSLQTIDLSNTQDLLSLLAQHPSTLFVARYTDGRLADRSRAALEKLAAFGVGVHICDVTGNHELELQLRSFSGWQYLPQLYVAGEFVGGAAILDEYLASGEYHRALGLTSPMVNRSLVPKGTDFERAIWRVLASRNAEFRCTAGANGSVSLSSPSDKQPSWEKQCHEGWVNSICFNFDETVLFSVGTDRTIYSINLRTHTTASVRNAHSRWINDVCPLPEEDCVATASADRTIAIWRTEPLSKIVSSIQGKVAYWCVRAVREPKLIAAGDAHGVITWFDAKTLKCVKAFPAHRNCITSMDVLENSDIVTGGYDGIVCVTNTYGILQKYVGHTSRILSVVALPGGSVGAGAADGRFLAWKGPSTTPMFAEELGGVPLSLTWSQSEGCVLAATSDGRILKVSLGSEWDNSRNRQETR